MKTVLFDLDGTLLPLSMENFRKIYFPLLVKKGVEIGIDKDKMKQGVLGGLKAMVENDGSVSNETVFCDYFESATGVGVENVKNVFD